MNDKSLNSILLAAILTTALLVIGVHFMPDKRLTLVPDASKPLYLLTEQLPDGRPSSEWTNADHTSWQCNYIENFQGNYFPCGWTLDLSTSHLKGMDLSRYDYLTLKN